MKVVHTKRVSVWPESSEGIIPSWKKKFHPFIEIKEEFNTPEELIAKYTPMRQTAGIILAINDFFAGKRNSVTFNYGKGNRTFYVVA